MNPINTNISNNHLKIENPREDFKIEGGILDSGDLRDLTPEVLWQKIPLFLSKSEWHTLFLTPGEMLTRERLEWFAKLKMEIPLSTLIKCKEIALKDLQELIETNFPPLHVAAYLGSRDLMKKIYEKDKDLNSAYNNKQSVFNKHTPLYLAFLRRNLKVFKWLLKKGASTEVFSHFGDPLLCCYKDSGLRPFASLLISHGLLEFQIANDTTRSLHYAVLGGNLEYVMFLIKAGASPNLTDSLFGTPLCLALRSERSEIAYYLLTLNAYKDDPKVIEMALEYIHILNLHQLIKLDELQFIKAALSHPRLNKNMLDADGVSALQLAVCRDKIEIVSLLLEKGFDPNQPCTSDISPLHIAAHKGNEKMVALLLKYQANKEAHDYQGALPWHRALSNTDSTTTSLILLESKYKCNIPIDIISTMHNQARVPYMEFFYKKLFSTDKAKGKESDTLMLLAHIFELAGTIELFSLSGVLQKKINLEGMLSNRWLYQKLFNLLGKITEVSSFPSSIHHRLSDLTLFSQETASKTDKEFYARFHEGKPVAFETGYLSHNVVFYFEKMDDEHAIFGICNRHYPIELFRMHPSVLTEEKIGEIRSYKRRTVKSYDNLVGNMKSVTHADPELDRLEKGYPLHKQKVGNCVWASFEASLWLAIAIQYAKEGRSLTEATELFNLLVLELGLNVATKYFVSHLKPEHPFQPDMTLCHEIMNRIGNYSSVLQDCHKELSINFATRPWKTTTMVEVKKSEKLTYATLCNQYYC